jgi:WD40 repeat protein
MRRTLTLALCLLGTSGLPAADKPDPEMISRLIDRLSDADFARRQEAARQLEKIGAPAAAALEKALQGHADPDVRLRAAVILRAITQEDWREVRHTAGSRGYWLNRVAVTPDGRHALAAGGALILYDLDTGKQQRRAFEVGGARPGLALSRDGRLVLTGHAHENFARLVEAATFAEVKKFANHAGGISAVALSPDASLAATAAADGTLRLWDVASGRQLRRLGGFADQVRCLAFAPDGGWLLSGHHGDKSDFAVRLWDVPSGKPLRVFRGHGQAVTAVAFLPSGRRFVSSSLDGTVRLWESENGKELRRLEHGGGANDVAVSPDGRRALSAGWNDHKVRLWDLSSGKELCRLDGHTGRVLGVAFAPDGKLAVSCDSDCTVRVWRPAR